MTNTNPVTCAEVGHCVSKDGDDTCMRCGAVDGWIPHTGNECPVPGDTIIRIMQRRGLRDYETRAGDFKACWDIDPQNPDDCDIVFYRIVTPANHPAAGLDPSVSGGTTQGWRTDMEDAPRDGTRILVSDGYIVRDAYFSRGEWWEYECGDDWYSCSIQPTCWMPLPQPPAHEER